MTVASTAHHTRRLRFGLAAPLPRAGTQMRAFAQAVEAAGFDVLAFPDHLVPSVSPFAGATAAAMATQRLHTGTLVLNNDFRHPVDTAREAAGVATLAEGRFELGLGAGHRRSEYDAAGITFDSGATRVARLIESAHLIRALLDAEPVDFDGQHYRVHAEAGSLVAPPKVRVPLLVGGNGTEVLRLGGRIADIVGLAGISHNRDATQVRFTHFDADGLADRIAVVRHAAGDRFEAIELNALIQAVVCTNDRNAAAAELAATLGGITPEQVLESPFLLLGTHEQMAEARRAAAAVRCQLLDGVRRVGWPRVGNARHRRGHRAPALRLGPRMGPLVHRPQPGDRDVGVQLRGRQAGMTEQLLDHPQVGATFQQVGRRAVPQPVRPHIGCAVHRGHGLVHRSACLPHVKAPAPGTQQQRVPGLRGDQRATAVDQPGVQRIGGWLPERDGALLVALAEHPNQPMAGVDVVDVQAAQLADPDTGGVQQLDDQPVPQR